MSKKTNLLLTPLLVCCSMICFAQKGKTNYTNKNTPISCSLFLKRYAEYWQKDSIGDNGFRLLAVQSIKASCKLEGGKWELYKEFFGKANVSNSKEEETYYRFKLTNYVGADALSNRYLEIVVDRFGKIKLFYDWVPG